jgi:hypothetical protein
VIAGRNRASAVLTEAALARVEDRERLRVLPLRRLSFEPIVLVTSRPEAPRAESRP